MTPEEEAKGTQIAIRAIAEGKIYAYHPIYGEMSEQGVTLRDDERTPTMTRFKGDGTNVYDLTAAELKLRRDSYDIVDFYRKHIRGFENAFLRATPPQVGVRETRQILGGYKLDKYTVLDFQKRPEDTIARGCWLFDIHCPRGLVSPVVEEGGMCSKRCPIEPECYMKKQFNDQLLDSPGWGAMTDYYDIPYACLVPRKMDNLLVSGRCISADHFAMSSVRVVATCMAVGQAAGTAASLSLEQGVAPRDLPVQAIQRELRDTGVPLGDDQESGQ